MISWIRGDGNKRMKNHVILIGFKNVYKGYLFFQREFCSGSFKFFESLK
jgi:hypothetical protein